MSFVNDGSGPVHSRGPAILLPAEAIGNVVTKTNILISSHRNFLANLPRRDFDTTTPAPSLITPPPSLKPRVVSSLFSVLSILPECSSAVSSASIVGVASLASLSSSLSSAISARSSIQTSAFAALAGSSSAISALSSISSSISASAASAIAAAQSSASQSVSSANSALSSIQSSANAQAISLNSAVAAATLAIQQAQASASSLSQQANASKVAAMNTTKFALAITFAILGSSLLSILIYFLITRCRRRRREARQLALKEKIIVRPNSEESHGGPSLSDFPMPVGRNTWSRERSVDGRRPWTRDGQDARSTMSTEMAIPIQGERQTWAPNQKSNPPRIPEKSSQRASSQFPFSAAAPPSRAKTWHTKDESRTITANDLDQDGNAMMSPARPTMVRKNTLTYDPEHPERPPKFTTWLEESFRSVSPFPRMGDVNAQQQPEIRRAAFRRSEAPSTGGGVGMAM